MSLKEPACTEQGLEALEALNASKAAEHVGRRQAGCQTGRLPERHPGGTHWPGLRKAMEGLHFRAKQRIAQGHAGPLEDTSFNLHKRSGFWRGAQYHVGSHGLCMLFRIWHGDFSRRGWPCFGKEILPKVAVSPVHSAYAWHAFPELRFCLVSDVGRLYFYANIPA